MRSAVAVESKSSGASKKSSENKAMSFHNMYLILI